MNVGNAVEAINAALMRAGVTSYGLADLLSYEYDGSVRVLPCIIEGNGEGLYIDPSGVRGITSYHRLLRSDFATGRGYGDGRALTQVSTIKLVTLISRPAAAATAKDIASAIVSMLPEGAEPSTIEYDANRVISDEYKGFEGLSLPSLCAVAITYKIREDFRSNGCISNLLISN